MICEAVIATTAIDREKSRFSEKCLQELEKSVMNIPVYREPDKKGLPIGKIISACIEKNVLVARLNITDSEFLKVVGMGVGLSGDASAMHSETVNGEKIQVYDKVEPYLLSLASYPADINCIIKKSEEDGTNLSVPFSCLETDEVLEQYIEKNVKEKEVLENYNMGKRIFSSLE